jgi:hypothetical protein
VHGPELAILGALAATIDLAIVALVAVHPELQARADGRDVVTAASAVQADHVIVMAQTLVAAIARYRTTRRRDRDELPC